MFYNPLKAAENSHKNKDVWIKAPAETNQNALTKGQLKAIIKQRYKNARVKDVDIEVYNGQKVYDVDFIYRGKPYEAFITAKGRILKVQIDPNVDDGD
ncbi:PepSY domain-containing protein [Agaribacter marinus]|uniref:PepSY domain-containing protein n=1 Tax=Agaribacter marinus TaxID=1431249 RepID=A0AA37T5A7_9ALTE|nr:PepSY domain-containing protein [Agaribacter marinus]GLR71740.1 hypothetical protein GCM10007852_26480 [Agaribacter marinus]